MIVFVLMKHEVSAVYVVVMSVVVAGGPSM